MNRRILTLVAAGATAAFALALPLGAAPKGTDHGTRQTVTIDCAGGTLTVDAPNTLWPPNHKYAPLWAKADADTDTAVVELETTGTHDQYEGTKESTEKEGAGNTIDDIIERDDEAGLAEGHAADDSKFVATESSDVEDKGLIQTDWGARAERAGTVKAGRTYTFTATATFDGGDSCTSGAITFNVPHDMRPSNRTAPS